MSPPHNKAFHRTVNTPFVFKEALRRLVINNVVRHSFKDYKRFKPKNRKSILRLLILPLKKRAVPVFVLRGKSYGSVPPTQ